MYFQGLTPEDPSVVNRMANAEELPTMERYLKLFDNQRPVLRMCVLISIG